MPPKEVRSALELAGSNDGYSPSSVRDHEKQIAAGAYGETPLNRRAQEKFAGGDPADFVAEHIAMEIEETGIVASLKTRAAAAKREEKLARLRKEAGVATDIDDIWSETMEDIGPAPVTPLPGDGDSHEPDHSGEGVTPTAPAMGEKSKSETPETDKGEPASQESKPEPTVKQEKSMENSHTKSEWAKNKSSADDMGGVGVGLGKFAELFEEEDEEIPAGYQKVKCDQCEMLRIQGIPCHETGCPNERKTWDPIEQRWQGSYKCWECGEDIPEDEWEQHVTDHQEPYFEEEDEDEPDGGIVASKTADAVDKDVAEAGAGVDADKADLAGDPVSTKTVNPEHFAAANSVANTGIPAGTRVQVTSADPEIAGMVGELTHAFGDAPGTIAGLYLDNNERIGLVSGDQVKILETGQEVKLAAIRRVKADTADNPYNMADGKGAPDNKKTVEKKDTTGPAVKNTASKSAAGPSYQLNSVIPENATPAAKAHALRERQDRTGRQVQCLDCGHIGASGRHGRCEKCDSAAITDKIYTASLKKNADVANNTDKDEGIEPTTGVPRGAVLDHGGKPEEDETERARRFAKAKNADTAEIGQKTGPISAELSEQFAAAHGRQPSAAELDSLVAQYQQAQRKTRFQAKKADTADNEYDVDSALVPHGKETGASPTVDCHKNYDKERSKGFDGKTANDVSGDMSEAKSEVVSPDTVDNSIQQPTESVGDAGERKNAACMCGDPGCPSCGAAMGTYPAQTCPICGKLWEDDLDHFDEEGNVLPEFEEEMLAAQERQSAEQRSADDAYVKDMLEDERLAEEWRQGRGRMGSKKAFLPEAWKTVMPAVPESEYEHPAETYPVSPDATSRRFPTMDEQEAHMSSSKKADIGVDEIIGEPDPVDLEDDLQRELMHCPECGKNVHTKPAEGVPAQALRVGDCGDVFWMDLESEPEYDPLMIATKKKDACAAAGDELPEEKVIDLGMGDLANVVVEESDEMAEGEPDEQQKVADGPLPGRGLSGKLFEDISTAVPHDTAMQAMDDAYKLLKSNPQLSDEDAALKLMEKYIYAEYELAEMWVGAARLRLEGEQKPRRGTGETDF
jgi:hypothetical protein